MDTGVTKEARAAELRRVLSDLYEEDPGLVRDSRGLGARVAARLGSGMDGLAGSAELNRVISEADVPAPTLVHDPSGSVAKAAALKVYEDLQEVLDHGVGEVVGERLRLLSLPEDVTADMLEHLVMLIGER